MTNPQVAAADIDPYLGSPVLVPKPFRPAWEAQLPNHQALERNVRVGPLWVSSCRCPHCGELYAHAGMLMPDEPDPPCWRCEVAVDVPLSPVEVDAMADFRWKYDDYLAAIDVGSGISTDAQRERHMAACNRAMQHAPVLLKALERRYGNQQEAGIQRIASGE